MLSPVRKPWRWIVFLDVMTRLTPAPLRRSFRRRRTRQRPSRKGAPEVLSCGLLCPLHFIAAVSLPPLLLDYCPVTGLLRGATNSPKTTGNQGIVALLRRGASKAGVNGLARLSRLGPA